MRLMIKLVGLVMLLAILGVGALLAYSRSTGLRALDVPGQLETRVARVIRSAAVPPSDKARVNPLAGSADAAAEGLQHFARYCALCHANNGSGQDTPIGGGLYPRPPDLRATATQQLTDGELAYIIENGVRLTGMPGFGGPTRTEAGDRQLWQLVTFIRKLPSITPDEIGWMESLNPL